MNARLQVNVRQKNFGPRAIIHDVKFDVAAGEIVAVLGASGCGKSTLLRVIAGLDRNYVGNISICGNCDGTHENTVGVVYQEPRLMPWLTVEDNIKFGLIMQNTKNKNANIDGLLQEVMLESARQYLPKQLSGGMAQRVAIARALVREPDVLLMDEPFSSLDVLTRRSLHALTREVTARHQTATVVVTHDVEEAVNLASRVLVLTMQGNKGAMIQHDIRPSESNTPRHEMIEAIINSLEQSQPLNIS
jgi:sulfonate transport system ATP-binding protein